MPRIAIVDDRDYARDMTAARVIRGLRELADDGRDVAEWEVIQSDPLARLEDYSAWLEEEEVAVLLLDERLNESYPETGVGYFGHDVVESVAPRRFGLPIYYVTADPSSVEDGSVRIRAVLDRTKFAGEAPKPWVREFIEEGERYLARVETKLARLSEIAEIAVESSPTDLQRQEARSLREELQLPFTMADGDVESIASRSEMLGQLERGIAELRRTIEGLVERLETGDHGAER